MKAHRLAVCYTICVMLLLLLPLYSAHCQNYVEYSVQVNSDGSAIWKITSFSDVDASVDTLSGFQNKVTELVNAAATVTGRGMTVDENSLQINTTISATSKTTEYSFMWQNFSVVLGNQIIFGDVFAVTGFFSQLYGDAALQISYPSTFGIKSVTPAPYQQDNLAKTLQWARTQDLAGNNTKIILTQNSAKDNSSQNQWQQIGVVGGIVAAAAILSSLGFYIFRRRRTAKPAPVAIAAEPVEVETEEGKILKLLKSSGGSMRQSAIVEQCKFSKAKTSQLLTLLEKNGSITRYKKGRDKIVNLTGAGEK